ncbi:hypothetical protein ABID78_001311 [Luteibacter sp. PvP019]
MLEAMTFAYGGRTYVRYCTVKGATLLIEPMRCKETGEAVLRPLPGVVLFVLQPPDAPRPVPGQVFDAYLGQRRIAWQPMRDNSIVGPG